MILYRCFAWDDQGDHDQPDGPLWFPRVLQGEGRHDNPDIYGCLYLADRALSSVVEQIARFRGQRLTSALLRRRGLPLALAEIELADSDLINLDDPAVLRREKLRPSLVATRNRTLTQAHARALYEQHQEAAGVAWWSTYESLWVNVTVFDRASTRLKIQSIRTLTIHDPAIIEAARFFELRVGAR